ncbi:MarR family transcriptional regulator [Lentilactobacillus curieae]|uniref:MarR family transcriptional regulator n=1 Tax=Lentilactobacillus curieae TaxID=1138822 RepID=A0A1S6QK99_9LACO|nr:MarR family transcriptional regulator [Lentilactobacillus curieae]AQW22052.1 MarR family transcriptional regulator [Lentilactobacillus curieae]
MKEIIDGLLDSANAYLEKSGKLVKQDNLTMSEWRLLQQIIAGHDTQEKLANVTNLDISTLSRQLKRLVTKEMVTKVTIGPDRRQLKYSVTERGNSINLRITAGLVDIKQRIFTHWTEEELRLMKILINRLDNSIGRI